MSLRDQHEAGLDILGGSSLGLTDFVPWLGAVGKIAGGLLGGGSDGKPPTATGPSDAAMKLAVAQALLAQQQKEAQAKAEADARRSRTIMYSVLGAIGVGGIAFAVARRK